MVAARGTVRPVRAAVRGLVADLTPTATRLGREDGLATVTGIAGHGGATGDSADGRRIRW